jgi:hypothetical protein
MRNQPWVPFYNGDWVKDPALRMCSAATRGIWIDLICAMYEMGQGSITGTLAQISRIPGVDWTSMLEAIEELRDTNAATVTIERRSRDARVTLICRRLEREFDSAQLHANRQDKYRARKRATRRDAKGDALVTPERRTSDAVESESESEVNTLSPSPLPQAEEGRENAPIRCAKKHKPRTAEKPAPAVPFPPQPEVPAVFEARPSVVEMPMAADGAEPEYFRGLLFAADQAGLIYAEGQLARLAQTFARLPTEERRKAIEGIEVRLKTGEYANGFVPTLKRYLGERLWTARLRPGPFERKPAVNERPEPRCIPAGQIW